MVVRKKCQTALEVSILPEEIPALLPTVHLSDHVTNCPLLWAGLQEGDTISNVVCLSKNKQSIVSSWAHLLFFPPVALFNAAVGSRTSEKYGSFIWSVFEI